MPLHAENEAAGRAGRIFYGFYDAILWAAGGDAEPIPGSIDCLMVAGVDRQTKRIFCSRSNVRLCTNDLPQDRIHWNGRVMRDRSALLPMVHGTECIGIEVLDQ